MKWVRFAKKLFFFPLPFPCKLNKTSFTNALRPDSPSRKFRGQQNSSDNSESTEGTEAPVSEPGRAAIPATPNQSHASAAPPAARPTPSARDSPASHRCLAAPRYSCTRIGPAGCPCAITAPVSSSSSALGMDWYRCVPRHCPSTLLVIDSAEKFSLLRATQNDERRAFG